MKSVSFLLLWVCSCAMLFAQEASYYMVKAEQGDGIFSLLRKQGLDPAKHYEAFVKLNSENIKDGSFLKVGTAYKIPQAADALKKTGVVVRTGEGAEEPIFDGELAQMSLKSDKLKDAVYYIITEDPQNTENDYVKDVAESLAADLMVHGAKVYIMGDGVSEPVNGEVVTANQKMGSYIEVINKRYIQNTGKYQRVLVIRADGVSGKEDMDVAVYHYNKSEEGQRLAENIQNMFKRHSVSNRSYKDINMIFEDKNSLYLARNILPAISLLTLENASKTSNQKIAVRPDKKQFASLISDGIMNDYVDLQIEN
ncbi:N-acetylmuramoyl-L-alanine amidase [Flagellimonas taeanensis]|uniref:N-acetylmuramoyl-L-alanine amidase n=1 Tax=Flagellimonas taeanensis TaxID=1005926 RepID=A0A1M6PC72_9FLAO|nr:N-acetylmuramoyl-L-alanine amidase [Allomuricauda taeanensis]SFB66568.1 N-acetylmuramoyl-L-alanine amidase [Allomuricauda taeanensis]SHK05551.1 N-acetylmuramoyl-L-alanine amidase [Allomuricauda taeanensis]